MVEMLYVNLIIVAAAVIAQCGSKQTHGMSSCGCSAVVQTLKPDPAGGAQERGDIQRPSRKLRQFYEHHTKRSISNKCRGR